MTVVAITGHRPDKIDDPQWVHDTLSEVLTKLAPEKLIQGMAAGVDLMSSEVAYELGIPFLSAKPWAGHAPQVADEEVYRKAVENAVEVVNVNPSEDYLGPHLYQRRNEYMVDNATVVVAVWDGTKGGTRNCVVYARRQGKPIIVINPDKKTVLYPESPEQEQMGEPLTVEEQGYLF